MDPFTIAAGIGALGSLFKGILGFGANNAQAQAQRNAAQQAEQQGGVAASEQIEQGNAAAARAAVQGAANGGGFGGSTLGVIQDLSNRAMFNARAAAYRGRQTAVNDMYDAQVSQANGANALIGGVVDAGSSLLGGWAKSSAVAKQTGLMGQLKNEPGYANFNPSYFNGNVL
ncbi:MAG TPA: hypothetical protein VMU59_09290 [Caulobacteraceae bacterium]|nr:hypothetical protein [Caulobacteraceae bacterium]